MKRLITYGVWLVVALCLSQAWAGSGSDNFNRTSSPLDGTWTNSNWTQGPDLLEVNGTAVTVSQGDDWEFSFFTGYTSANNQQATVTLAHKDITCINCIGGPTVRTDIGRNFYCGNVVGSYSEIVLFKGDGTTDTLAFDPVTTWVEGDTIKIEAVGTTLNMYRNGGGVFLTIPNGALVSGQPGVVMYADDVGYYQFDDFSASDVAGGAAPKRQPAIVIQ